MKRRAHQVVVVAVTAVLMLAVYYSQNKSSTAMSPGYYLVTRAVDGDTIEVDMDGVKEKIRMIGVDTPETHHPDKGVECFGVLASEYTKSALEGKRVRLESDETNQNRDRYQRLLRYVYTEQGALWNAELISNGYAHALTAFPFTKMDEFKLLEQNARVQNKGLWSACQ